MGADKLALTYVTAVLHGIISYLVPRKPPSILNMANIIAGIKTERHRPVPDPDPDSPVMLRMLGLNFCTNTAVFGGNAGHHPFTRHIDRYRH